MNVQLKLKNKIGTGIQPQQFMDEMTKNKDQFLIGITFLYGKKRRKEAFFESKGAIEDLYCLILCTDWCPDVIWNVPVLFRVMEHAKIPTEVLLMEHHLETMDLFLTDGGRAQPIAIFMDSNGHVLGKWVPVLDIFKPSWMIFANTILIVRHRITKRRLPTCVKKSL